MFPAAGTVRCTVNSLDEFTQYSRIAAITRTCRQALPVAAHNEGMYLQSWLEAATNR